MANVLAVDDEPGLRELIAEALSEGGHQVSVAADGVAALHQLEERPFDLLILDLRMPGELDGMQVLREARARWPGMQVIVLTAYGSIATAVEAMRLGAFHFLEKPFDSPEALRRLAARALNWRGVPVVARGAAEPVSAPAEPAGEIAERFLDSLRRRHLFNVAATYAAVAFVVLQAAQLVLPALPVVPGWTYSGLVATSIVGFPAALLVGWLLDVASPAAARAALFRGRPL